MSLAEGALHRTLAVAKHGTLGGGTLGGGTLSGGTLRNKEPSAEQIYSAVQVADENRIRTPDAERLSVNGQPVQPRSSRHVVRY